jgi:putative colanic acid biosynthesis acetyltransferase WcaF
MSILDAQRTNPHEGGASFSLGNRLERLCWNVTWLLLARWTPNFLNPWRVLLLKVYGAVVETGAAICSSARIWLPRHLVMRRFSTIGPGVDCYDMASIEIGEYAIVSQGAVLCGGTHDIYDRNFQLQARPIVIGNYAWIAAEAFVGPGVVVGEGSVLGARACAFQSLQPWTVYLGNPATAQKPRRFRQATGGVDAVSPRTSL